MDEAHVQSQKNIYLRWKVPLHKKGYNQYVIMQGYIAPKGSTKYWKWIWFGKICRQGISKSLF